MNINELTGYKNTELFTTAKNTFDYNNPNKSNISNRINNLETFQQYMTKSGFKHLGSGAYGSAYIHPSYKWVWKIFNNDPAYLAYLHYIKQNKNINLPIIKGPIIKITDNTYTVRMEKLFPLQNNQELLNVIKPIFNHHDLTNDNINYLKQNYPGILQIINDMKTVFPKSLLDLHKNNILQRENNTPVIIDPICQEISFNGKYP